MKFVLHYRGSLRSNGDPVHKHEIRSAFHAQLAHLWKTEALRKAHYLHKPPSEENRFSSLRELAPFVFVPLLTEQLKVVAEVEITIMRPEPPGGLITQGGDIDNRIKTLLDALTMPRHRNALPKDARPAADQQLFFCLLEDDNMVTSLSVRTEQLLETLGDPSEVDLTIRVQPRVLANLIDNWMFGG